MSHIKSKIVILGAGYAGMFLATNLEHNDNYEIILVDRNPYHQLLQEIHLVATGFRTTDQILIPIPYLIKGKEIKYIKASVNEIFADRNEVILDGHTVRYDILVICLGSSVKYFNIQGAETNTLPLRSITDAEAIYKKLRILFNNRNNGDGNINSQIEKEEKKIIIVGGGATGVSLAGAIADMLNIIRNKDNCFPVSIIIIEALPEILPGWNKLLVEEVKEILKRKGIKIITNQAVLSILQDKVIIKNGEVIDASLIIWTAGVRGYDINITPAVDKTPNGRIIVNRYCQHEQYNNIFAIGDIAAVKDNEGKLYPPLAQIAVRQAKYLADMLPDYVQSLQSQQKHKDGESGNTTRLPFDKAFNYTLKTQIISLGYDDYVGILEDLVISGSLSKLVDEFAKNTYIKTLRSGGKDISSNLYDQDIFSKMLSGITFAGFTFAKWLGKRN